MNIKILIIEDDELAVEVLTTAIDDQKKAEENIEFRTATNGKEALALAKSFCPDVILMDKQLEDREESSQFAGHLKEICHGTKIIVISATNIIDGLEECLSNGADCYFEKPLYEAQKELLMKYIRGYVTYKMRKAVRSNSSPTAVKITEILDGAISSLISIKNIMKE